MVTSVLLICLIVLSLIREWHYQLAHGVNRSVANSQRTKRRIDQWRLTFGPAVRHTFFSEGVRPLIYLWLPGAGEVQGPGRIGITSRCDSERPLIN